LLNRPLLFPKTGLATDSPRPIIISNSINLLHNLSDSETQAQRHYKTSARAQEANNTSKKIKVTRISIIDKMADSLGKLAYIIGKGSSEITKNIIDSIIKGQV
jgi:hypothetical protein